MNLVKFDREFHHNVFVVVVYLNGHFLAEFRVKLESSIIFFVGFIVAYCHIYYFACGLGLCLTLFDFCFIFEGEQMNEQDVEILLKECCDPEDEDGCIPYESKREKKIPTITFDDLHFFILFFIHFTGFLERVCEGPHKDFFVNFA